MRASKRILALHKKKTELRLAILDDDPEAIAYVKPFVDMTDGVKLIYSTTNPEEMLQYVKANELHILLLDMEMPKMGGMELLPQLKYLKETNPQIAKLQVIICTAHQKFAVDSFKHKVADYLTKPITFDRYLEAIHEVKQRFLPAGLHTLDTDNECLTIVLPRGEIKKIPYREIIYVEAMYSNTQVWLDSDRYFEVKEKFYKFLPRLPKSNFVRVHRSYAISLAHFRGLNNGGIQLHGTDTLVKYARRGGYELFDNWLAENVVRGNLIDKRKNNNLNEQK
ncbi:response regulator transcription factor [Sphingobacterium phlebotomi]|uniref:Response regulator transcription factor n=1 Tax=Sphingobacterium phlebotomi TaxID=2605433 RepID=A0A5D4H9L0_9SPHI|nr:LytTR family DNA-binding domain-containing protein [Sphingobacterium phlebotomi]TYR36923.1 response regulator transcription factor [Sphingobacterium phlebotomi]